MKNVAERFRVRPGERLRLKDRATRVKPYYDSKAAYEAPSPQLADALRDDFVGQYETELPSGVKCFLDDSADIGHFVTEHVQALPGIRDTFTMMAYKAFT